MSQFSRPSVGGLSVNFLSPIVIVLCSSRPSFDLMRISSLRQLRHFAVDSALILGLPLISMSLLTIAVAAAEVAVSRSELAYST